MIRATLVLLVAHVVIPRLRGRSAAERHLLWVLSLMAAATLPLIGTFMPSWHPDWARRVADALPALSAVQPWTATQSPDVILRATAVEADRWELARWVLAGWTFGALVCVGLLTRDATRLMALVRSARAVTDRRCLTIAADLTRVLHLAREPILLVSPRAVMPMTWGWRRPRVLLPIAALSWPRDRVHAVLAHELAHVHRADWLWHLVAQIACSIYWWHPLFWSAERALGRESEQAADDTVLDMGVDGSQYADHLIDIVRASREMAPRAPAMAMGRPAHLERRIAALLHPRANRTILTRPRAVVAVLAASAVGVPIAALGVDRALDVDIRTVDLPQAVRSSITAETEPMLPSLRAATSERDGTVGSMTLPQISDYTTPPLYSDEARRLHLEGIVTIAVHVDQSGRLTSSRVVSGLGAGLDQNALVALRQWRFRPGTRGGTPAAMNAEVDIAFDLRSEAVNELIANDMATLVGPDVIPPRVIRSAGPPLRGGKASGSVVLDVVLLQNGSPKIVRILRSLSPEADESAVRHFEQWRFAPATRNGVPVKVRMNAEVRFHD